jgi:hypothetical protein
MAVTQDSLSKTAYANQITSLSITFDENANTSELILNDLPALEELTIQALEELKHEHISAITGRLLRLPATLPSLKVIHQFLDTTHLASFGPAGVYLTNLDGGVLQQQSTVIHLLQLCPNLFSFKIYAEFYASTLVSFTHKIQIFRILTHCDVSHPSSDLFNALSPPDLRVLEHNCSGGASCPDEDLKACLARSKCPLESLFLAVARSRR